MENEKQHLSRHYNFPTRISHELKRAERYRIFVSLLVINFDPIIQEAPGKIFNTDKERSDFLTAVYNVIRNSVREVDTVSNSGRTKMGILCPETSRQGAEAAARRIQEMLAGFCSDYFDKLDDLLVPVEISSYPDAAGARSIASYSEEFID